MKDSTSFVSIDPQDLSVKDAYQLLIHAVIPRPIALVSTQSLSGLGNLAPFSYFNAVSSKPAVLSFAVTALGDGTKKHTLRNIEETGQFVINSANEWMFDQIVDSAADYPFGVNELEQVGLTAIPSTIVKPARVKESAVQFECELYQLVQVGDGSLGSATLVLGKIVNVHVRSDAINGYKIDPTVHRPINRLGGVSYAKLGEILHKPVPKIL